jgi:hypothetical protein
MKGAAGSAHGTSGEASVPGKDERSAMRTRIGVYALTGHGCEEYAAAGGGTWCLRSVFAVCASLDSVWTVLRQNITASPQWRNVRCHEVPLDALLVAPQPRKQEAPLDVSDGVSVLSQPLEAGASSLDLRTLLAHFAPTDDERAAVALTLADSRLY